MKTELKKRVYSNLTGKDIRDAKSNALANRKISQPINDDTRHCITYDSDEEKKKKMFQKISAHAKTALKFQQAESSKQQIIFCTRTHS